MTNKFRDRYQKWLNKGLFEETADDRIAGADLMVDVYYEYTLALDKIEDLRYELGNARQEISNLTYQLQEVTSAKADGRANPEYRYSPGWTDGNADTTHGCMNRFTGG